MNASHTPGPWKSYPANNGSCIEVCNTNDGSPVAAVTPQLGDTENANAALIAAAPELLAALQRCIAVMEQRCPEASPLPDARAAIAKATGG